ncbi:MAG TPA: Ig-like domain-containing protein [Candidatus Fimenecus stercoravium]|nr:Ig-like domain-containing protein [Candidatus Fimenecus stercoravium]
MQKRGNKALSIVLCALLMLTMAMPALVAAAADAQIVITDEDGAEVTERLEVKEFESIQLGYTTSGDVPAGAYVTWESSQPLLAGVDENGEVHGYDFSKEAIVHQWLDENVRVLPLIGDSLADSILQTIEDQGIDLADPADIELLITLVGTMGGSFGESLANSLRETLDNMNIEITATLHAADGSVLASDTVEVVVAQSTLDFASIYPTAVHITNKNSVPTTVAVGATVQLYGVCTPVRLEQGIKWTMGGTIFDTESGKHATVSSDGLVTFTSPGEVTVRLNPESAAYAFVTDTITFNVVSPEELPVTSFEITGETEIDEGETTQLAITNVQPAGAYTGDLVWESSDPTVAVVDQTGLVTGLDGGSSWTQLNRKTNVTASIGSVSRSVEVQVNKNILNAVISGVEIVGNANIPNNTTTNYTMKVTPDRLNNSSDVQREWGITEPLTGEIVWATADVPADTSIATLTADGALTPKSSGIMTIHARATQGETVLETSLTVNAGNPITSFEIYGDFGWTGRFTEGDTVQLELRNIQPADYDPALLENVIWTSSNPSAISVDENGEITGMDAGGSNPWDSRDATITATIGGVSVSTHITVYGGVLSELVAASVTGSDYVIRDFPISYTASYTPPRLDVKDVHWGVPYDDGSRPWEPDWDSTSGNQQNSVASVDNNGTVTGLAAGSTTVWYFAHEGLTSVDGSYVEATKDITVVELEPESITITAPTRTNYVEGETELDLTGLKVELNYSREAVSQYYDTTGWSDSDFTVEVTDYTVGEINQSILDTEQYIIVTVTRAGTSYRGVFTITLESKKLTDITLENPRYAYNEGEYQLDLEGLTVTANYSNAASEQVTDYTVDYSAFDPTLLDVEQQIPVTYTHAGLSATATFPVIVYGYPVVTVDAGDYAGGWTTGDVTLSLSATHPMDGLTYSYYTDSDPTWRTIEGDTLVINTNSSDTYYFKAVNSVGMESAVTEPITVQRDDVTPSFTLTPAVQELTNMSYLVSVENVNVGPSGIQSVTLNGEPITDSYATFRVDQNGEYTVVMTANNGLSSSQTLTVENIDKEVPTVTEVTVEHKNSGGFARFLNDLTFGLFFNEEVELTAAAEDTGVAGLDRIEYRFYNDETETYSEWQVYDDASKPTQLPDFRGYAEVRAYDRAGNVSAVYTSDGYVVDGTAPTDLQVTALFDDEIYADSTWVADDVEITLESTAFSGIYEYQYRIDGGEWQSITGNTMAATEEGTHLYEFKAISNAALESPVASLTVCIDRQQPVIRVEFDGTFGRWTADGAHFSFSTEAESLSGITYYYSDGTGWYAFDGADLHLEENTNAVYAFKAVNGAGTESIVSDSYRVMIDTTEPDVVLTPTVTDPTCVPYAVNIETVTGESGIESLEMDGADITGQSAVTVSENGYYLFTVTGGNGLRKTELLVINNFYTPVLEISDIDIAQSISGGTAAQDDSEFGSYYKEDAVVTIDVNNTGAGEIEEIRYRLLDADGTPTTDWLVYDETQKPQLTTGFKGYVEAQAFDTTGLVSELYVSEGVTVDTTAPTAPAITATNGDAAYADGDWANGSVTLTVESSAFSGISGYLYRVDGGDWQPLSGNTLTATADGTHTYAFKAVSNATLESEISEEFTVQIDSETPILQVGVDGAVGTKTEGPITFTLYTPNCLSDVTYYYNCGDGWMRLEGNTLTLTEETQAEYRFKAVNAAGKESYESPVYAVHIEKEELKLIVPKDDGSTTIVVDRSGTTAYLTGMTADTTVDTLRAQLQNEETQIRVLRDGVELSDGELVGTGCVVQCVSVNDPQTVYESVTVLLMGDVDGDGAVTQADYSAVSKAMFNPSAIAEGVYRLAADLNGDTVLDGFDLAQFDLVRSMSAAQA